MEPMAFIYALEKLGPYGVPAIMAVLFYMIIRSEAKNHLHSLQIQEKAYTTAIEQHQKVLEQYKGDLSNLARDHVQAAKEMRQMYDSNARLVEAHGNLVQRYADRAEHLEKLIQTNIQCWQMALKAIEDNRFCPRVKELGGKDEL